MRKHINSMEEKELKKIPFHSWECISLESKAQRSIDLVIHDQEKMDMFLKYLIYELKSYDGQTGTSKGLIAAKFPIECQKFMTLLNTKNLEDEHQLKIQMISE